MLINVILVEPEYDRNTYFKYIPDDYRQLEKSYEYRYDYKYDEIIANNFMDYINVYCSAGYLGNATLDDGDVDYLNVDQCKQLVEWIELHPEIVNKDDRKPAYDFLLKCAKEAIEIGNGMVIQL